MPYPQVVELLNEHVPDHDNLFFQGLLAYRLWIVEVEISRYRATNTSSDLLRVAYVVMNSGAIYSIGLILYLALYFAKSDSYFIVRSLVSDTPVAVALFQSMLTTLFPDVSSHFYLLLSGSSGLRSHPTLRLGQRNKPISRIQDYAT